MKINDPQHRPRVVLVDTPEGLRIDLHPDIARENALAAKLEGLTSPGHGPKTDAETMLVLRLREELRRLGRTDLPEDDLDDLLV